MFHVCRMSWGRAGQEGSFVTGRPGCPADPSMGNTYSLPHAQLTVELLFLKELL